MDEMGEEFGLTQKVPVTLERVSRLKKQ